ncbi:aldo/keto reductase [Candidatus Leptofilum sp.]|uniref:aldo/keto reductase n=1 Tax=Candidatus Leptofilum sp. TaxID=3241576 RepID=UPI003B5A2D71
MLTRKLGKSGLEVSAIGMGCWAIGGPWRMGRSKEESYPAGWGQMDDNESIRAIHAALDLGINLFDTAANYGAGHSEVVLGRALAGRRDQAVIATKFGHIVNEAEKFVTGDNDQILKNVRQDVENSLRRLQTEYIDVYQLHEAAYDPELALTLREELEALVKEGKIHWYGWSTDLVDRAQVFADGQHCTSIQFRLNAVADNPEMRQLCSEHNLAGLNKDPLNKGILTGKYNSQSTFPQDDIRSQVSFEEDRIVRRLKTVEALREVFTDGGRTMAQGALCYILGLDERMLPIPGFKNVQQVKDNASTLQFGPMSAEEVAQVQAIVAEYEPKEEQAA